VTGRAALVALALGSGCRGAPPAPSQRAEGHTDASTAPDTRAAPDVTHTVRSGRCGPWEALGRGVSVRRCDRDGPNAAALLAGWAVRSPAARAWADALDDARLRALGVSTLYAVDGPAEVDFRGKELDVDGLLRALDASTRAGGRALVVAHSSGAHVAATMFHRAFVVGAAAGLRGRVVYVDLDGDAGVRGDPERDLHAGSVGGLRRALFVATAVPALRLEGFSRAAMLAGARAFPERGSLWTYDATGSGCRVNACAHLALVDARPTARGNESYARSTRETVNTAWLARVEPWLTGEGVP